MATHLTEALANRCPHPLPFAYNKRRPIDHLHSAAAVLSDPGEGMTPLNTLHEARWLQQTVDAAMHQLVNDARDAGATWQQIGESLGISRQAAQQRFGGAK